MHMGFPGASVVKNPPANAGDVGSIPGSGRSSGRGNGNPLQCSCLENPTGKGAWWATVHGVTVRHNGATKQQYMHTALKLAQKPDQQTAVGWLSAVAQQGREMHGLTHVVGTPLGYHGTSHILHHTGKPTVLSAYFIVTQHAYTRC